MPWNWHPRKKRELGHRNGHVRTQGEDSVYTRERGRPQEEQPCPHLDPGCAASRTGRDTFLLWKLAASVVFHYSSPKLRQD